MERSVKHEPQEACCIDEGEESKSCAGQCTDASMVDTQPQSLIMHESPLISDQDQSADGGLILRRHP